MARPLKKERGDLSSAVVRLRKALGDTQQAFASRLGTAITTVARYETIRPPRGNALVQFTQLAKSKGELELAKVFEDALSEEFGGPVRVERPEPDYHHSLPWDEIEMFDKIGSSQKPEDQEIFTKWKLMTKPHRMERARKDYERLRIAGIASKLESLLEAGKSDEDIIKLVEDNGLGDSVWWVKNLLDSVRFKKSAITWLKKRQSTADRDNISIHEGEITK